MLVSFAKLDNYKRTRELVPIIDSLGLPQTIRSRDGKSVLTFEKRPLVAKLKLKLRKCQRLHYRYFLCFQFQLSHQRALFKCYHTFTIHRDTWQKTTFRFLIDSLVVK